MARNPLVFAALSLVSIVACSDAARPVADGGGAGLVCPMTVQAASSTKCGEEGSSCAVGYSCPSGIWQQAHCACKSGVFACIDATGSEVVGGAPPVCAPVPGPSDTCGVSVVAMNAKVCSSAGYSCTFAGAACPNGKAAQDVCVCFPSEQAPDGGGGVLAWRCEPGPCPKPQ